jgi:N-acetylneuraminate lyase
MDFSRCLSFDEGRFDLLFGTDELLICALALGAKGAVGSTYNFAAPLYVELMEAFHKGDLYRARALQRKSIEMIHLLVRSSWSPQAAMKVAMKMAGVDCGPVRLPLRNCTGAEEESLRKGLNRLGFKQFCSS